MARKGLDRKDTLRPYRMQVTEAVCWSFMLFLRSRMLSEDWYTWTLWVRGDKRSGILALEVIPPPLCLHPHLPKVTVQGTRSHNLLVGFRPSGW